MVYVCVFACYCMMPVCLCECVLHLHRYNPEHGAESRLLRHRAVALQDMAHSFLDHELSEDFEKVG